MTWGAVILTAIPTVLVLWFLTALQEDQKATLETRENDEHRAMMERDTSRETPSHHEEEA